MAAGDSAIGSGALAAGDADANAAPVRMAPIRIAATLPAPPDGNAAGENPADGTGFEGVNGRTIGNAAGCAAIGIAPGAVCDAPVDPAATGIGGGDEAPAGLTNSAGSANAASVADFFPGARTDSSGISNFSPHLGQIPRLPARNVLTFSL